MRFTYYGTDIEVEKGDIVEVKRWFRWRRGVVSRVYDPNKPSIPQGENEFGYGILFPDGTACYVGTVENDVRFIERGATSSKQEQ